MLVLGRREEEGIFIGDYYVRVLEIRKHEVKLGIVAPKDVNIRREELDPEDAPDGCD